MRKLGTLSILAAVLALLALPALLGAVTERQVRMRIESMQEGSLTATLLSYERGWFSSRAKIELKLSPRYLAQLQALDPAAPKGAAPDQSATLLVDFAHGPIVIGNGLFFGLSETVARLDPETVGELERRVGVPYFFRFRGRTSLLGNIAFDAQMPPVHLVLDDTELDFSGAVLAGTLRARHLVSSLEVGSITFQTPAGALGLRNLTAGVDAEIRSRYVMPGTLELTLEHAMIADTATAEPLFEVSNLKARSDSMLDPSSTQLEIGMSYSLDSLTAEGMLLTEADLGIAAHKLDVEAMERYFDGAARLAAAGQSTDRAEVLAALSPVIARGLAAGPSLVLDPVHFRFNDEPFDARLELAADSTALPPVGAVDLEDPSLWLSVLRSAATIEMSKALARQLAVLVVQLQLASSGDLPPEQWRPLAEAQAGLVLATLTSQGLLQTAGDSYRTDLDVADGLLTVNGRPMPLLPR